MGLTSAEAAPLASLQARPYAVELGTGPEPAALIALLHPDDQPAALWGRWFRGGVVVMRCPLRTVVGSTIADIAALIDDQPSVVTSADERSAAPIGGGWLSCAGFGPGTSAACFYDSLLRWRPSIGWSFEALGLEGRDDQLHVELEAWRGLLGSAASPVEIPVSADTFNTITSPAKARLEYLAGVDSAINRIHAGDFYQLNLCTRLVSRSAITAPALFAHVARRLDPAYGALMSTSDPHQTDVASTAVASFSPELFLRVRGSTVVTQPIKGTAPRHSGDTDSPALRASAKDAAENIMIVDLMRHDLGQVCRPGTVSVDALLEVQAHPGVWHLVSTVSGQLADGVTSGNLLSATFPPGSVTGAPKSSALRGIDELEPYERAVYTGTLGLDSPIAGTDRNVLIRTLELRGDRIELGVGGITVDSVPVNEWYECLAKAAPLVSALGADLDPGLSTPPPPVDDWQRSGGLLETMLAVGPNVLRLAAHLARLDRSCRELYGQGLPEDLAGTVTAVAAADTTTASSQHRIIRVVALPVSAVLRFDVTVAPRGPGRSGSSVALAERSEVSWRHKWANRREMVQAEQRAGGALPYFITPAGAGGQVAETSRGNLFCQRDDGVWVTPPLDEHLLPGVMRRDVLGLLERKDIEVRVEWYSARELRRSAAAFWTSSVSGAVAITAVDGHPVPAAVDLIDMINLELGTG